MYNTLATHIFCKLKNHFELEQQLFLIITIFTFAWVVCVFWWRGGGGGGSSKFLYIGAWIHNISFISRL